MAGRKLERQEAGPRAYLSVGETANLLGLSEMTLYRAIAAGEFPAVRIRGRLIVPARAIEQMSEVALRDGAMVDAASWALERVRPDTTPPYAGDRGSVPVLPLIGFAVFLAAGSVVLRMPLFAGLCAVMLLVVGGPFVATVVTVRRERRANVAFGAAFNATQRRFCLTRVAPTSQQVRVGGDCNDD